MSWCRWGSKCSNAWPPNPANDACPDATCPGSSLYIFEADGIICMDCPLMHGPYDADYMPIDFVVEGETEMLVHLREHDRAGHHVRKSLLEAAAAPSDDQEPK